MLSSCGHPLRLRDPARQSQNRNREGKFESPPTSRTDLLTRLGVSPAPGRTQAFGERKGARRDSLRFLRERGRRTGRRRNSLLCWGYCAGKADGARVNQWALNFRIKTIWLPKRNTGTNSRLEKTSCAIVSGVLTEGEDFGMGCKIEIRRQHGSKQRL